MTEADVTQFPHVFRAESVEPDWYPSLSFSRLVLGLKGGFGVTVERRLATGAASGVFGLGITAFLNQPSAQRAKEMARGGQTREFLKGLSASDLLKEGKELRIENASSGLSMLVYGGRADALLDQDARVECTALYTKGFLETHIGFNIREFFFVVGASEHRDYLLRAGSIALEGSGGPPWLIYLDAASGRAATANIFSVLFQNVGVELQLSTVQQRLLLHALNGRPDEDIAEVEGVTLDAVKKRWANLFDQVSSKNRSLLPGLGVNGRRGAEKRGKLLDYVRQHPQELRPTL